MLLHGISRLRRLFSAVKRAYWQLSCVFTIATRRESSLQEYVTLLQLFTHAAFVVRLPGALWPSLSAPGNESNASLHRVFATNFAMLIWQMEKSLFLIFHSPSL